MKKGMMTYDLAIHGFGMLPGLVALHLLERSPGQSLLLLSSDTTVGGEMLEPVVRSSLTDQALRLVDGFVVARWPGYMVTRGGVPEHHADEVLLLDPVQLWLELGAVMAPHDMATTGGVLNRRGRTVGWSGGDAQVADLVDLSAVTRREQTSEILGLEIARSLSLPVLVDLDTGDEPWDAFRHIPLGDERVYVSKHKCHGPAETELTVGFGKVLSDLIAY